MRMKKKSRVLGEPRLGGPTGLPLSRRGLRHLDDGVAGPPVPEEGESGPPGLVHEVLWRRRHGDVTSCAGGGPGEVEAAGGAVVGGAGGLGGRPLSRSVLVRAVLKAPGPGAPL